MLRITKKVSIENFLEIHKADEDVIKWAVSIYFRYLPSVLLLMLISKIKYSRVVSLSYLSVQSAASDPNSTSA